MLTDYQALITIVSVLLILLIFVTVCLVHYYSAFKEEQLRYDTLKNTKVVSGEDVHKYEKLNNLLIGLFYKPPVALAKGKIRNTFELQLNGIVKSRIKTNKRGEPTKKETHKGELYFEVFDNKEYISWKNVKKLYDLTDVSSRLDFIEALLLEEAHLVPQEN